MILGLVLGPLMERNLRRALALSGGEWGVMFSSGLAVLLWLMAALAILLPPVWTRVRGRGRPG